MATQSDPEVKIEELESSSTSEEEEVEEEVEDEEDEEELENYMVEEIKGKRFVDGKLQYLLKWQDYKKRNWEPVENINCPELIADFERKWTRKQEKLAKKEGKKRNAAKIQGALTTSPEGGSAREGDKSVGEEPVAAGSRTLRPRQTGKVPTGRPSIKPGTSAAAAEADGREWTPFDKGLEPEKILGMTDRLGERHFIIKWKDTDEIDYVPASVANVRCPIMVIDFYEERIMFGPRTRQTTPLGELDDNQQQQ